MKRYLTRALHKGSLGVAAASSPNTPTIKKKSSILLVIPQVACAVCGIVGAFLGAYVDYRLFGGNTDERWIASTLGGAAICGTVGGLTGGWVLKRRLKAGVRP
jgi:hypothetical protein